MKTIVADEKNHLKYFSEKKVPNSHIFATKNIENIRMFFEKLIGTLNYSKVTDSTIAVKEKTYFDESLVCWHSNTIENLVQKWIRQTQPHTLKPTRFIFAGDFISNFIPFE